MKVNIVSRDKRFSIVNEKLNDLGISSRIADLNKIDPCDALILSPANELSDDELRSLLANVPTTTTILSGNAERIKKYTECNVIDYTDDEDFLVENARITAESTISYLHTLTNESVKGKRILVCGYGRIGKRLCEILYSLGAKVYVYTRRRHMRESISYDGYKTLTLDASSRIDIILNTTPSVIFEKELIDNIPDTTYIVELASAPGGFACTERVNFANGLPGKILPISGAKAMAGAICGILFSIRKDMDE